VFEDPIASVYAVTQAELRAGPPPLTSDCEGRIIAWSIRIGGHVMDKYLRHPIYLGFLGSGGIR
jgi:hypothetical protein